MVADVLGDVWGEYLQSTADESNHTVGMGAGSPTLHRTKATGEAVESLRITVATGQLDEILSDAVQAEDTWPALAGALVGHVRRHACRLGDAT